MNEFGIMIKNLRNEHRITQRDMAKKIGVDFTYISKIENGKLENAPSEETIEKIARVLETDVERLIILAKKIPKSMHKTIVDDELAVAFLRKMPDLTPEQRSKVKEIINED